MQCEYKVDLLFVLAKPALAVTVTRQTMVHAGAVLCHPPAAPHPGEWTRGWMQTKQLPASDELVC